MMMSFASELGRRVSMGFSILAKSERIFQIEKMKASGLSCSMNIFAKVVFPT